MAITIPGFEPAMKVPYLLFINNTEWADRCPKCRKTMKTVLKEEAESAEEEHDCIT